MPKSVLDATVARVTSVWSDADCQAVVLLDRFDGLPPKVIAEAKKIGYNNNNPDERIYGVAYDGKIYLIHENLYSELDIEDALLLERLHLSLRSGGKAALIGNRHSVLFKMGGFNGLLDLGRDDPE